MRTRPLLILGIVLALLFAAQASQAQNTVNGYRYKAAGCTSLGSALSITGQLFELDATCSSSTDGSSQTWANIVASPADSSTQTAYDFYRGATSSATTDDPTFNGSAGSSSAYWSVDGGDFFQIAAGNTAALNNINKTTGGQPVTVIWAFKTPSSLGASTFNPFGSSSACTGHGVSEAFTTDGRAFTYLVNGSCNIGAQISVSGTIAVSTDYIFVQTLDYTGGAVKYALNARTLTAGTKPSGTDTTNADGAFQIGYNHGTNSSVQIPSGTRVYGFYVWNKVISNGELDSIVTALNARHGRTYALLDMRSNVRYASNDLRLK